MHRARARIPIPGVVVPDTPASGSEGMAERQSSMDGSTPQKEMVVLRSMGILVPQPSRSRAGSDGKLKPYGTGRSGSSSGRGRSNSLSGSSVWIKAKLYLTERTLCYDVQTLTLEILLEDMIGITIEQTPPTNTSNACELTIHYFPVITKWYAKKKARKLISTTIQFAESEDFKDNLTAANEWKTAILLQTQRATKAIFEQANISTETGLDVSEEHSILVPRTFLVFINPMAGTQKAEADFKQYVQPMFDLAEINYVTVVTERQNHAHEMIKEYDLDKIDGILISSGDGVLYEVINGIMERQDWEKAIKTPIGMLPTGSGNALAASTIYESKEDFSLEMAAFQIIRGGVVPMDLATIQLCDGTSTYMSLLGNWGIVADVDIESERFRKIGDARFTIGALASILKKKIYRGRLSYIASDSAIKGPQRIEYEIDTDPLNSLEDTVCPVVPEEKCTSENVTGENGACMVEKPCEAIEVTSPGDKNTILNEQSVQSQTTKQVIGQTQPTNGPSTDLLVPLTENITDSTWTVAEDDYFGIAMIMVPFMGKDFYGDPTLQIGSGNIRLLTIDGKISRIGALGLMASVEKGSHTNRDDVCFIDVKAFRLEPITYPGIMTVDGERVSYGPIQGQVHPGLARVMSRKRVT